MRIAILTTDNREFNKSYEEPRPRFGASPEALLQGFELLGGIGTDGFPFTIDVIGCAQQRMRSPGFLAPGLRFHSLHVPKIGWLRTGYQGCIRAVRNKLREINPDLVHGQGTERECAISAVFSGYKNVLTIHGNMSELGRRYGAGFPQYRWFASKLEDLALKRTAGVLCNSAYTESLVAPRTRRTWRVPNPLRMEFFQPQNPRPANPHPILLNVGVISPRKRQVEILEMARTLYAKGLRFQINFIGSCDETPYGCQFLEMLLECAEFARYTPHLPTGELIARFDEADALIHFPEEEAFGLVVAEALTRNLKLFGARLGGIIDICTGVEGADLVDEEDWKGLSHLIEVWIKEGYHHPVKAASVMAERYHPKVIARQHLLIYRELLGAGCRSEDPSR
jgi:glycosyltransferase involved in cell wall biosynthesis